MSLVTISGHVDRALDFYNKSSLWIALAHPFDWNIVRLESFKKGPYTVSSNFSLKFKVNAFAEVTVNFVTGSSPYTTAAAVSAINTAAALVDASLSAIASAVSDRIRITAPVPGAGFAYLEITLGSEVLGFYTGDKMTATAGGSSVPIPDPSQRRLMEPFAFKKVMIKDIVVPDVDTAAIVLSTNQGNTFNTSVAASANVFSLKVNGSDLITVTFPDSTSTAISTIVSYINTAANAESPDYAAIASIDASVSPPKLKITSPTKGSTSTIEIVAGSPVASMDIDAGVTSGVSGGAIRFRTDQFRAVDEEDAFDEGARIVYVQATFAYDEVPLNSWAQMGLYVGLTPKGSVPPGKENLTLDEVESLGILSFLEHRKLTARAIDSKEVSEFACEF